MSDLDRRALLGVAGVASLSALASAAKAGPLTPPAGAVAGTGRTTDEIYNKIPAVGGADGRTPIGTAPFTISAPGSYVLTANLTSAGTVLTVLASNVTLDLNGFSILCTGTTVPALQITGVRENITIRNGTIDGGSVCINTSGANRLLIEYVRASNAKTIGINIGSSASRGCVIRRCVIEDTGSTTVPSDGSLVISAVVISGSSCRMDECVVSRLFYNGAGLGTFRTIHFNALGGSGNVISRCTVSNDTALTATGIIIIGAGVYRDNTVVNFSNGYNGGTDGGGNF